MSGRKLNALERAIHQSALAADDKTLTGKELESLAPEQSARTAAVNFLLGAGLLKVLKDSSGKLQFRAVVKKELDAKKDLSGEESLVLGHIQAAGNEGIWTKHIKVKTELHQTVIDRCLKSLTQKKLVKCISGSVQHPTRKIYMLFHLEPSTEMTGGPWYTDKELDTEFIKLLSAACLKFIRDRSFPRNKSGDATQRLLYPISSAPAYPTATQVQAFLNKSRITETQLTVEHVETLLNVLVLDGDVEKVPALGATLWDSSAFDEDAGGASEDERPRSKKRKRDEGDAKRKKKRRRTESSSDSSDSESDSESDSRSKRSKSKSKSKSKAKKRKYDSGSESSGEESDAGERERKRKKKRRAKESGSESESDDDDEREKRKKKKRNKSKSKRRSPSPSSSSSSTPPPRKPSSSKKSKHRSPSPSSDDEATYDTTLGLGGAHVYRAVHAERMASFGLAQAPCGRCPTFEFCKAGGPVNAVECVYYGEWLGRGEVKVE